MPPTKTDIGCDEPGPTRNRHPSAALCHPGRIPPIYMYGRPGHLRLAPPITAQTQERHQIELERNRYYEEQKSSANMLQFYTDIAHELKTPLSLIAAPVEELLMNPHIGETTRKRLELVSRNTAALTTLLEQILDLRKYENHKMNLVAVQTDLTQFLRRVAELFRPLADNLRISFSIELPETPIFVRMDRDKMETVVVNLLYNAFKYTRKGSGKVDPLLRRAAARGRNPRRGQRNRHRPQRTDPHLRAFLSGPRTTPPPQKSVGIGLALSKHIVELHHGTIEGRIGTQRRFALPGPAAQRVGPSLTRTDQRARRGAGPQTATAPRRRSRRS